MNRITINSRVSSDGVLHLDVPFGAASANQVVKVTVEPVAHSAITQEQWRNEILGTAGKWLGDFKRLEQGNYEQREPLA